MNWIPGFKKGAVLVCIALSGSCNTQVADSSARADPSTYRVDYRVTADPASGNVRVTMRVAQSQPLLRELSFRPGPNVTDVTGDGELFVEDAGVRWRPAESGGAISWQASVPHRRNGDGYDAWLGPDFGLFRAEDIIPRAATRTRAGAQSDTRLTFRSPATWSVVTEYFDDGGQFLIDNPERRFDQPTGWIVMGELGVRRERVSGVRVAIAGPAGHSVRRLDTIALLNWTLPELARVLPELPPRLTIVSAGDPMWRGALSAPQSIFLHADRPLISENATSTVLHEVMHLSLGFRAARNYDWIVEGLAEYYSLQLLLRSGTITPDRYRDSIAVLRTWARQAGDLCRPASTAATTALAVGVFEALDREIAGKTEGKASLDDLARKLWRSDDRIDAAAVSQIAAGLIGSKPDSLHSSRLPGCRTIAR